MKVTAEGTGRAGDLCDIKADMVVPAGQERRRLGVLAGEMGWGRRGERINKYKLHLKVAIMNLKFSMQIKYMLIKM